MHPDHFFKFLIPDFWNDALEKEFQEYAIEQYPNEACAAVIKNKLVKLENISNRAQETFELTSNDKLLIQKAQGLIHSHPNGQISPSAQDMLSQKEMRYPFGIMVVGQDSASKGVWWSDDTLSAPLEGRPFIHGIFDCYSLCRAYYKQSKSLVLPDFPRDDNWWLTDQNMYLDNFTSAGFKEVESGDTFKVGDAFLMAIQTKMPAHAAVYLGNDLILHHLRGRLSRSDRYSHWRKYITNTVRYSE